MGREREREKREERERERERERDECWKTKSKLYTRNKEEVRWEGAVERVNTLWQKGGKKRKKETL